MDDYYFVYYNPIILRNLRRYIYELANSVQTSERIAAVGFEHLDDVNKIKQFIFEFVLE